MNVTHCLLDTRILIYSWRVSVFLVQSKINKIMENEVYIWKYLHYMWINSLGSIFHHNNQIMIDNLCLFCCCVVIYPKINFKMQFSIDGTLEKFINFCHFCYNYHQLWFRYIHKFKWSPTTSIIFKKTKEIWKNCHSVLPPRIWGIETWP